MHRRSTSHLALGPDAAAAARQVVVFLDDIATQYQPEAMLAAGRQGAVGTEEGLHLLGCHAAASVGYGYVDHLAVGLRRNSDAARRGMLQGIVYQVAQQYYQQQ